MSTSLSSVTSVDETSTCSEQEGGAYCQEKKNRREASRIKNNQKIFRLRKNDIIYIDGQQLMVSKPSLIMVQEAESEYVMFQYSTSHTSMTDIWLTESA